MKRIRVIKRLADIFAISLCFALATHAKDGSSPLKLAKTISLPPEIEGHFDHLAIDLAGRRLFLTPEDYKAVLVLDSEDGHVLKTISGIGKPHAILFRGDLNRLYVTDGVDGALKIFDGTTYQLVASLPLEKDADSISFDLSTQLLRIVNGGGDVGQSFSHLSTIDTNTMQRVADLQIPGDTLEAIALDAYRPRLYLNNKAKNEVTVIDTWQRRVVASWPVTKGKVNVAMALDEPHQRLFVACRDGHAVIFDTNTGAELQSLPIAKGVDDAVFDRANRRLYTAGDGAVTIYQQDDADHYQPLGEVPTGPLGRTALLVPELNEYLVAVPKHGKQNASVMVFEGVGTRTIDPPHDQVAYRVEAPVAQELVRKTLSAHPELRKLGLHAVQPGQSASVIIANGNAMRRGIKTTDGDFKAVAAGATYCKRIEDGSFYNLKMLMFDAQNRRIGLLVMEIPFTAVKDDDAAVAKAESVRSELEQQIASLESLFERKNP